MDQRKGCLQKQTVRTTLQTLFEGKTNRQSPTLSRISSSSKSKRVRFEKSESLSEKVVLPTTATVVPSTHVVDTR